MAKIQGILINADNMFRDNEKETVELEGNVQIVYQGQHMKADKAHVYLRTHRAELLGNVEISDTKSTIVGDQVNLDYENNTGIIYNGYVSSGPVTFSGTLLEKTGDQEFIVSQADYTTCTNCPASWSFLALRFALKWVAMLISRTQFCASPIFQCSGSPIS